MCAGILSPIAAGAADSAIRPDNRPDPFRERLLLFGGADVAHASYFFWSGVIGAPLSLLHEDGLRVRFAMGRGRYRYRTGADGTNTGDVSSAEAMAGWRFSAGGTFATVFVGAHIEDQSLAAPDPAHPAQGTEAGAKIALDLYRRFTPDLFAAASASASTVHRGYHARAALARELSTAVAAGIEAGINGDARYHEQRAGIFVQTKFDSASVSLAGGYLSNSDKGGGFYATLSLHAEY